MSRSQDAVECARAIRPVLQDLVGADAQRLDQALVALIERAQGGEDVGEQIMEILARHRETRAWADQYMRNQADEDETPKGFDLLTSPPGPIAARIYVCPQGDYSWARRSIGQAIPLCPKHKIPLKPA